MKTKEKSLMLIVSKAAKLKQFFNAKKLQTAKKLLQVDNNKRAKRETLNPPLYVY